MGERHRFKFIQVAGTPYIAQTPDIAFLLEGQRRSAYLCTYLTNVFLVIFVLPIVHGGVESERGA